MIIYNYEADFKLINEIHYTKWIKSIIKNENKKIREISYIFCDNKYILNINKKYLNHIFYTDIITFDYCEKNLISGDIFISIEMVKENALSYNVNNEQEIQRVMVHGILHLCGYKDKNENEKKIMKEKEDFYLKLF